MLVWSYAVLLWLLHACYLLEGHKIPQYLSCKAKSPAPLPTSNTSIICPRYNSTYRGSKMCKEDRYTIIRHIRGQTPMSTYKHFKALQDRHNIKILLAGDSLSTQMTASFHCSMEAEGSEPYHDGYKLHIARYLSKIPHPYRLKDIQINSWHGIKGFDNDTWFNVAIEENYTHLVLNTGAWYTPTNFQVRSGNVWRSMVHNDEALAVFKAVFAPGGRLLTLLKELHDKHNVTIIWRDIAPAGSCTEKNTTIYEYWDLFPMYNDIARAAIESIGGYALHGIWKHALPRWQDHIGNKDFLHWCLFRPNSVPSYWNDLLIEFIRKQYYK